MKIGNILKVAIKSRNMTQNQVAKELHISPQVLSNYVTDKRTPHLECFFDLIDLLDLEGYFIYPHLSDKAYLNTYLTKSIKSLTFQQKQVLYLILRLMNKEDKESES